MCGSQRSNWVLFFSLAKGFHFNSGQLGLLCPYLPHQALDRVHSMSDPP